MPTAASAWDDHDNNNPTRTKQVTNDFPINDDSQCTGDHVTGTGRDVFTEETTTSGKQTRTRTSDSLNGTGTGSPSTAQYKLSDFTKTEHITPAKNWTDIRDEVKHLIRTSRGVLPKDEKHDDEFYHQYTRTTVSNGGDPEVSVERTRLQCK
jgi:hypothetical protein